VTSPTVDRTHALVARIERLDDAPGRLDAVALGLVDALLAGDEQSLTAALEALRSARAGRADADEGAGRIDALIGVAHSGLERIPSRQAVSRGTQAHDFLSALAGAPQLGSTDLRRLLETDESQVSRTGRRLLELGLVTRRKIGRQVFWQLTPRGRRAVSEAPASVAAPPANAGFWEQALRRGFDTVHGGEPPARRETDPTRERIIESALALHSSQGIQVTTWSQIAERAGVPEETVEQLFPTLDALVRSCGAHFMEGLQIPPPDRARDVFTAARSENERIRRMTSMFFGAYERGADGLTAARRERTDVPALDESMRVLDGSFDALVVEALRPAAADTSAVASVRALTDIEVWRALREQGATTDAAVDRASTAVERWLDAHPVR
jgi:AcrR family transcriptional regulator